MAERRRPEFSSDRIREAVGEQKVGVLRPTLEAQDRSNQTDLGFAQQVAPSLMGGVGPLCNGMCIVGVRWGS